MIRFEPGEVFVLDMARRYRLGPDIHIANFVIALDSVLTHDRAMSFLVDPGVGAGKKREQEHVVGAGEQK